MRKIVFLLVMAFAVAGLSWADGGIAHPPGVLALEAGLSEYGVQEAAVTSGTVSDGVLLMIRYERPADFLAFPETIIERASEPRWIGRGWMNINHKPDYWLRL